MAAIERRRAAKEPDPDKKLLYAWIDAWHQCVNIAGPFADEVTTFLAGHEAHVLVSTMQVFRHGVRVRYYLNPARE